MKQSIMRFLALLSKEFIEIRRDHLTMAMMIIIPLLQLVLFGFAINTNPKNLPTALVVFDPTPEVREITTAIQNTQYFKIIDSAADEKKANALLAQGKITFWLEIPAGFTQMMIRGQTPTLLVVADASDPSATGYAISTLNVLLPSVLNRYFSYHGLSHLIPQNPPFNTIIHSKYNPEQKTVYYIVPGLFGVILTMTMVMITGMAITRERERGTIESLLATPAHPLEIIAGKVCPYMILGYIQLSCILIIAKILFGLTFSGSIPLLFITTLPFVLANLMLGITFSTLAKTQLQAMQMTIFFFLPSILLSGFMFPFYGMPEWAQVIGQTLPLTYYLRITRGIILKGNDFALLWQDIWPLLLFIFVMGIVAVARFKRTL